MALRVFQLGELIVEGRHFRFVPGSTAFEGQAGDDADLTLLVRYREGSAGRETCTVTLTVRFGSAPPAAVETVFRDRPLVKDAATRRIGPAVRLGAAGETEGTFAVQAHASDAPWSGRGPGPQADFSEEHKFLVRVRPAP